MLWIEYRGKTAPVALLKTYDATRGAQGSVDAPLSMRDSATAGSDNADLTIVYEGRGQQDGHTVLRFTVKFASHVTFSDAGWDLGLDARTGVLLSAVMHYSSATVDREALTVEGFDDHAGAVLVESVAVPGGYSIAAAIDGTIVRGLVVPSGGETIAQVIAQVRRGTP